MALVKKTRPKPFLLLFIILILLIIIGAGTWIYLVSPVEKGNKELCEEFNIKFYILN